MPVRLTKVIRASVFWLTLTLVLISGIVPDAGIVLWPGLTRGTLSESGIAAAQGASVERPTPVDLHIAGAASLRDVLDRLKEAFEAEHNVRLFLHFASSGTLRQQTGWGAPIDLLILVAGQASSELIQKELAIETVEALATNRLVLVRPQGRAWPSTWDDLRLNRGKRIAIGDPSHVPLGQYARLALQEDGLWPDLQPTLILANDARQVASYVQRGVVDAAIIYASDLTTPGIELVAEVPGWLYPEIRYTALLVKRSRPTEQEKALGAFVEFLAGDVAHEILSANGFGGKR